MKTVLRIFFGVLIFVSIVLTYVSFVFDKMLNDKDIYLKNILTEEFDGIVMTEVEKMIRVEGDQLALDYDSLCDVLDRDEITDFARSYTTLFINSILKNIKFDFNEEYRSDAVYYEIKRQITETDEEYEVTEEETAEDIETVYGYITDDINSVIKYMPDYISRKTTYVGGKLNRIKPCFKYGMLFLSATVLLTAAWVASACIKKSIKGELLYISLPFWFASAAFFIPSVMLSFYDSTAKLTISKSMLYCVLSGILETLESVLLNSSAVVFAAVSLVVFVSAYFYIIESRRDDEYEGKENDRI